MMTGRRKQRSSSIDDHGLGVLASHHERPRLREACPDDEQGLTQQRRLMIPADDKIAYFGLCGVFLSACDALQVLLFLCPILDCFFDRLGLQARGNTIVTYRDIRTSQTVR